MRVPMIMVSLKRHTVALIDGVDTDEIDYLSAIEEGQFVIAQANAAVDEKGRLVEELVTVVTRVSSTLNVQKMFNIWTFHHSRLYLLLHH